MSTKKVKFLKKRTRTRTRCIYKTKIGII